MSTIKEGLNLPKKKYPQAIEDMGGYYQINSEILIEMIEDAIKPWDGEVSYREISESNDNTVNFDLYFYISQNIEVLDQQLYYPIISLFKKLHKPTIGMGLDYVDTDEDSHMYTLSISFDKELRDDKYVNESILSYRKPLSNYVFTNSKHLKEQLINKNHLPEAIVNKTFKQSPKNITESLLQVLNIKTIKSLLKENPLKCTIDDVEKRAKKIVFVKYNWDPKNVVFNTERDVVQITAMDDLKPELQNVLEDDVIFKFLETLSRGYQKNLNSEFSGFCSKIKVLSSLTSDISSQVYCYTIIQQIDGIYFFSSNREKKRLKKGNHPQYTLNKIYYKIGLFASNVKTEGLNFPKKKETPEGWFLNLLNQMEQQTIPEYPNTIFFIVNGDLYMEYNINSHVLWYSYSKIQSILRSKFKLNDEQINELVKVMVGDHTNLRVDTTTFDLYYFLTMVGEHTN